MKENKIESLDCIRGIACLIVLIAHIVAFTPNIGQYASGCGKIGVWCFMIMSGFLSIYPYISGWRNCKEFNFKSIISYYLRKIRVLYPSFLIALLLGMYTGLIPSFKSLVRHLVCVESAGHFWYMPVIVKLYIVFPVFVILYRLAKEKDFLYGVIISLIMIAFCFIFPFTKCAENSNLLRWYVPVFCMGILLALLYKNFKEQFADNAVFDILCLIFVMGIIIFTPLFRELILGMSPSGWLQNKYLLMGALWSGIIISILFSKYLKHLLIKCKFFSWISTISYEVYLFHFIILLKLNYLVSDYAIRVLLVVVISFVLSIAVHFVFKQLNKKIMQHISTQHHIKKETA